MIVFQVSLNFDSAKEIMKMLCQIYTLMKESDYSELNTSDD